MSIQKQLAEVGATTIKSGKDEDGNVMIQLKCPNSTITSIGYGKTAQEAFSEALKGWKEYVP